MARLGIFALIAFTLALPIGRNMPVDEQKPTATQEVVISTPAPEPTPVISEPPVETPVETPVIPERTYTDDQLEILAIIIYQEAGGNKCSDDTRLKVGSVFLNRVASPLFPDTFEGVATAERQYGKLHWTGIKWPDRAKYDVEAEAVARAYRIAEELLVNGSVLPANVVWQAEFKQGDGVYCYEEGIYFCYSEVSE